MSGWLQRFFRLNSETRARKRDIGAKQAIFEELFNDYYSQRRNIYKVNFFRGIFFGLGSVFGGTVIVALVVWTLSLFVNIPLIGENVRNAQQTIEQRSQ